MTGDTWLLNRAIAVQSALNGPCAVDRHTNDAAARHRLLDRAWGLSAYLDCDESGARCAHALSRLKEAYALPEVVDDLGLRQFSSKSDVTLYHATAARMRATVFIGR